MKTNTPELLCPAGNKESLHAAVRAGADAVYLGTEAFNARRGADNFTLDTLGEACDFAHLRGVAVYLTLNTAILPDEADQAMELARQAYRRGVDAFIVQDIGVASELKRTLPDARLHISTQMNTHASAGIEAAAALGAERVTLARELSLEEIARLSSLAASLNMETEAFVHGALCVCYSGQCFMSSLIGGRSANRGVCAQACRLPYSLHNAAINKTLEADGEHLLSPKDLCAIELLPGLVEAGVSSFKIEGRMKSPDYVYAVTAVYRRALDAVLADRDRAVESNKTYGVPAQDEQTLAEAFSRGFTTAYLEGDRGNEIMSYGRPNNRGVFIGRVTQAKDGVVAIAAEDELHEGDVLEFWTNKGHFAHTISGLRSRGKGEYTLALTKRVGKGDRVFRVRSAAAGFIDDPCEPRVAVTGSATLRLGEPLVVRFQTADGISAEADGSALEAARTKPVTSEEVYEHIDRLGNLPFTLDSLTIDLDEGVGIGFSQLHKVRTRALKLLEEAMLAAWRDRRLPRVEDRAVLPPVKSHGCDVAVLATNPACAR
ncbi:MAG: U32 family peptidase, partial [Raoultibacter sp.]